MAYQEHEFVDRSVKFFSFDSFAQIRRRNEWRRRVFYVHRYLEVRGTVTAIDDDPDKAFVDGLSERYLGRSPYPLTAPGDERFVVHITPVHCTSQG